LFTFIYTAAKKTKDGAHAVGVSREALRNSIPFILERVSSTIFFLRKNIGRGSNTFTGTCFDELKAVHRSSQTHEQKTARKSRKEKGIMTW